MTRMENLELPLRLQAVVSLIPQTDTVVDVGSDHGKLGVWCLQNQVCKKVIATDIHAQPAERTRSFFRMSGWEKESEVYCTDGLTGIPREKHMCIVIAGMGGLEIVKILGDGCSEEEDTWKDWTFILQPQRSEYELREYLSTHGFAILEEKISFDRGHFYTIVKAGYTGENTKLTEEERFLGPYILNEKPVLFEEYMAHKKKVMTKKALGDPRCAEILGRWEALL